MNGYGGGGYKDGSNPFNEMDTLIRAVLNKAATVELVRVVAVNGDRLAVRPLVHQVAGDGTAVEHGDIHDVPYFRYQGGVFGFDVRPAVGDNGICLFTARDSSKVKATRDFALPATARRFDWGDALYIGGWLNDDPTQYVRIDDAGVTIKADMITVDGDLTVEGDAELKGDLSLAGDLDVKGNTTLGQGASKFVMLADMTPSTTVKAK